MGLSSFLFFYFCADIFVKGGNGAAYMHGRRAREQRHDVTLTASESILSGKGRSSCIASIVQCCGSIKQ